MKAFVILLGQRFHNFGAEAIQTKQPVMLRSNFRPATVPLFHDGWRPSLWTRSVIDAEKFGSQAEAQLHAITNVPHDLWSVAELQYDPYFHGANA